MEHSYPHLQIKNKVVYRLLQHSLWDTATKAEYFTYLSENSTGKQIKLMTYTGHPSTEQHEDSQSQNDRLLANFSMNGSHSRHNIM